MSKFNPYNHFGFLTNRVARLIVKAVEPGMEMDGHCFPASCIGILAELWANDGISQKYLGIALIKNKSSITKMLSALENEGLIIKKDDPEDGRGKLIYLTQKGRDMQHTIESKSGEMEELLLTDCSKEEIVIAKKVMAEMYEKLYFKVNGHNPIVNDNSE
ncbi:MAG: DNA-binding MarR family transcriptional regulator [Saprospiraceae bacterium]